MRPSLSFRPGQPEDREFLFQVYASTRTDELAGLGWNEKQTEAFLRMQFHAQQTHYGQAFPDGQFQVILENGQPIGRLSVAERPEELRLIELSLLPSARGRGLGAEVLTDLIGRARSASLPLRLHVARTNRASRLYARLGFREVRDEGVYLLLEWRSPETEPCT